MNEMFLRNNKVVEENHTDQRVEELNMNKVQVSNEVTQPYKQRSLQFS